MIFKSFVIYALLTIAAIIYMTCVYYYLGVTYFYLSILYICIILDIDLTNLFFSGTGVKIKTHPQQFYYNDR